MAGLMPWRPSALMFWAGDLFRLVQETALRAEVDAYRTSRLPPSDARFLRIIGNCFLCILLTGRASTRLLKLTECAFQHMLMGLTFHRNTSMAKLTAYSVNFPVYGLDPGSKLKMEGLFGYDPFADVVCITDVETVLERLSKGCCYGMCVCYILYHLHGRRDFMNAAAYGVPEMAQQIQLFCGTPSCDKNLPPSLKFLAYDRINYRLKKLCLRIEKATGPFPVKALGDRNFEVGCHLVVWNGDVEGHASVLVVGPEEVILFEPNLGEIRESRAEFKKVVKALNAISFRYERFSLYLVSSTEGKADAKPRALLADALNQCRLTKSYYDPV